MYSLLKLQQSTRRFLPRFDAGLIVRIDINQGTIKADRPLIERDQRSYVERVHLGNAHGD